MEQNEKQTTTRVSKTLQGAGNAPEHPSPVQRRWELHERLRGQARAIQHYSVLTRTVGTVFAVLALCALTSYLTTDQGADEMLFYLCTMVAVVLLWTGTRLRASALETETLAEHVIKL